MDGYTDNQKKLIYEDMLIPIKNKISKIVLYDTDSALYFLGKINELIEQDADKDLLTRIVDLEFEIQQYEKSNRKGTTSQQVKEILARIQEILANITSLSVEELQELIDGIDLEIQNNHFEFDDMDEIESNLYKVKARVLEKRVLEGETDLTSDISIKNEIGIRVAINEEIAELAQDNSEEVRKAISQLKAKMSEEGYIYDAQVYRMLNAARQGIEINPIIEQQVQLPKEKKESFFDRLKSSMRKEPSLPLKLEDLDKVTVDWLAEQILPERLPKDENDVTISPKMFILQTWDKYYKKQWDLEKRYDKPEEFEDKLELGEYYIKLNADPISGGFGFGYEWKESLEFKTKDSLNQTVEYVRRLERSKDNNKKSPTYMFLNYDSSGYLFTGPLSRSIGMINVISDVLGNNDLKEQLLETLPQAIAKSYNPKNNLPKDLSKMKNTKEYRKLDLASKQFEEELESQRMQIASQEEAKKKQVLSMYSDSLEKYKISETPTATQVEKNNENNKDEQDEFQQ